MENEESQPATPIATLRRELLARPEIVFAYLHGSFLSGGPDRDIDAAIRLDPARGSTGNRDRYALDLSVALHFDPRVKVLTECVIRAGDVVRPAGP